MVNYDLVEHIKITTLDFKLPSELWERFDHEKFSIIKNQILWKDIKYLNEDGTLNEEINLIDSTKGGIYAFYINPDIIPNIHKFLMYVGKAEITSKQNIRKRIMEYYDYVLNPTKDERPKVRALFHYWKKYIHVRYIPLDNNVLIRELEAELINSIKPPINSVIPDQEVRAAIAAFGG